MRFLRYRLKAKNETKRRNPDTIDYYLLIDKKNFQIDLSARRFGATQSTCPSVQAGMTVRFLHFRSVLSGE